MACRCESHDTEPPFERGLRQVQDGRGAGSGQEVGRHSTTVSGLVPHAVRLELVGVDLVKHDRPEREVIDIYASHHVSHSWWLNDGLDTVVVETAKHQHIAIVGDGHVRVLLAVRCKADHAVNRQPDPLSGSERLHYLFQIFGHASPCGPAHHQPDQARPFFAPSLKIRGP